MKNLCLIVVFLSFVSTLIAQDKELVAHFKTGDKVLAENTQSFVDNPDITTAEQNQRALFLLRLWSTASPDPEIPGI